MQFINYNFLLINKTIKKIMEEIIKKLTELIKNELSESQINKDNKSAEYRLGKNEAYLKILSVITKITGKLTKRKYYE